MSAPIAPIAPLLSEGERLQRALAHPPRPTPWYFWPLAALIAVLAGWGLASRLIGALVFGGGLLGWGVMATLARPIRGFYFCFAFYPFYALCRGLVMYFQLPIPLSVAGMWPEMVLTVMGVAVIVGCIRSGERLKMTWNDLPVALLMASGGYALALSLAQKEPAAGFYGFHATITPLVFYTVARWLKVSEGDLRRLLFFWLVPYALLAVLSLADYIFRPAFFIELAILIRPDFWGAFDPHFFFSHYPRMQSLMFSEQFWGTICGMVTIACLSAVSLKPMPRWPLPLFALAFVCLLLSMSRGALVGWAVAVGTLFVFFRGRHRVLIIACLVVAGVLGAVLVSQASEKDAVGTMFSRVTALADKDNQSAYDRVSQWKYALDNFPLYPAGRGLGRAGSQAMFHGTGDGEAAIADGGYFKILAEAGLPGLLIFIAGGIGFLLVLLRLLYFYRRESNTLEFALGRGLICMLCGLLVHNIGGNIFDAYYIQPLYWTLAGIFVTYAEKKAMAITDFRRTPGIR